MIHENEIRNFITSIAPEISVEFDEESDTCYDNVEELIVIGNDINVPDDGFRAHMVEKHDFKEARDYPMQVLSILHEIGHHFTIDEIEPTEEDFLVRMLCALPSNKTPEQLSVLEERYYNLPAEWEATEWAIDFIKTNPETVSKFAELFQ